jgi:protein involved in polysaccharide export with SLBB domain
MASRKDTLPPSRTAPSRPVTVPAPRSAVTTKPAPVAKAGPRPAPVAATPDYALGPGDAIAIHLWGANNDLSQVITVNPQGRIYVPRLGEIKAEGMSTKALEQLVRRRVAVLSPGTQALVMLTQARAINLYVYGQVLHPGPVPYKPGMRLSEAINAAGGPTAQAWLHSVRLTHAAKGHPGQVTDINAHDILFRARYDRDPDVKPDDVIFIPEAFLTVNNLKDLSGLILGGVGLLGVVANFIPR